MKLAYMLKFKRFLAEFKHCLSVSLLHWCPGYVLVLLFGYLVLAVVPLRQVWGSQDKEQHVLSFLWSCPYSPCAWAVLTPVFEKYTLYDLLLMLWPVAFLLCPHRQQRDHQQRGQNRIRDMLGTQVNCDSS